VNFQQLRSVREAVRQGFNLTEVAAVLHTSQPGVSRQIRELEDELGVPIFVRRGKRLIGITEPGQAFVAVIERLLQEADNLKSVAREFGAQDAGTISIATTHTQARYALPPVVSAFKKQYPEVRLHLHQGNPQQVAEMVLAGDADVGMAWSSEAELAAQEEPAIQYIYPTEGAIRWQVNLAIPSVAAHVDGSYAFINYLHQADVFWRALVDYPNTLPNRAALEYAKIHQPDLYNRYMQSPITNVPPAVLEKAHYLRDVGDALPIYDQIWTEIKGGE